MHRAQCVGRLFSRPRDLTVHVRHTCGWSAGSVSASLRHLMKQMGLDRVLGREASVGERRSEEEEEIITAKSQSRRRGWSCQRTTGSRTPPFFGFPFPAMSLFVGYMPLLAGHGLMIPSSAVRNGRYVRVRAHRINPCGAFLFFSQHAVLSCSLVSMCRNIRPNRICVAIRVARWVGGRDEEDGCA